MRLFDAHFHVIDPRFPLVPNEGYLPEPFTVADYRNRVAGLGVEGGAVVAGSFQAFDQTWIIAALEELGGAFVGVTQLPDSATDGEILELDRAGVRAVRFNLRRGGSAGRDELEDMAHRVWDLASWHVELYVHARELPDLEPVLLGLPAVSIDHLGLSKAALPSLRRLVERGVRVKASGFGRLDFDPIPVVRSLAEINPDAVLFGTDLPSTRSPRPFEDADVERIAGSLDPVLARKTMWENSVRFYRPRFTT